MGMTGSEPTLNVDGFLRSCCLRWSRTGRQKRGLSKFYPFFCLHSDCCLRCHHQPKYAHQYNQYFSTYDILKGLIFCSSLSRRSRVLFENFARVAKKFPLNVWSNNTVVPGFSVLGFRALPWFRALNTCNQSWVYVSDLPGFSALPGFRVPFCGDG